MRVLFVLFACLGMLVTIMSILDHSLQVSAWSAVVADASSSGALQDPVLAKRLEKLPSGIFSSTLPLAGAAITLLALWGFTKESRRPK
jgi:hypothetical protein